MFKDSNELTLSLKGGKSETFELPMKAKKLISKMLKEEISLNFSKFISPYILNKKQKKYFEEYLQEISKELTSHSHKKKGITNYIFEKYFELPSMLSHRLFTVFNNNEQKEYLSGDNFIENMLNLFTGGFNELSYIIFKLFDFKNDGNITSDEISIILSYIPISHKDYDNKKFRFEQDEFIDRIQSQEEISLALDILFVNKKSITYNEFVDLIKEKSSDVFIFLLVFILERKPFSKEIIEIYKNDDDCDEESEESEEEENEENEEKDKKNDVYIIPPTISSERPKTPKIGRKSLVLPGNNTPLNEPKVVVQSNNDLLSKNENEIEEKKKRKKSINLSSSTNSNSKNLKRSKSDEKLKNLNEKHIEDITTKVTYGNTNCLSEMNFIKLSSSEKYLFPVKRKSRYSIKFQENISNQKIFSAKSVYKLNNFKLNKNFGLNKIDEYEDSYSSSSLSSDENEDSKDSDKSENKFELSDDENNNLEKNRKIIKDGYLYKVSDSGKVKKLWFKLINNHLFYYKNKESAHSGMNCLIRVFVKESYAREINDKEYYCFALVFGKKEKEYLVDNEEDYQVWLTIFKKLLHCENINDLYNLQGKIGEGKYACVHKAVHKASERIVAVKILEKENLNSNEFNMIQNELDILKICQHPNIVKLYDVIEDSEKLHIIMELVEGPELFSYLEKKDFNISECEANKIIYKLSSALFYLNVFGIVHRDIKPENILLTNDNANYEIKLIDFGLGIILGPNEKSDQPFGTVSYVAPEVLCGNDYDKSVDIWSLGVLSYLLLVGRLPFDHPDDDENEIARQTINDPVPFTEKKWEIISQEAKSFVNMCLVKDPLTRINITEILKHDWIKKYVSEEQRIKDNNLEKVQSHEILKILCSDAI